MAKTCMLCPNPLEGDLVTEEHVIPNAIGGRRKVTGFICGPCNNKGGSDWESELAKQLLFFSNLAGVKRQRGGQHPDLSTTTEDGTEWKIRADGVMQRRRHSITEQIVDGKTVISIQSPNLETAANLVKKVVSEHAGDPDKLEIGEPRATTTYNDQLMQFNIRFGGEKANRSIVKSVLALLSEADSAFGVERTDCGASVDYLLDQSAPTPLGHCFYADLVVSRPTDRLFHCVSVVAQPNSKRILGYIEYFNCARFLVHVGDGYDGEPFQLTYALDPVTAETFELEVDFRRVDDVIEATLQSCGEPLDACMAAADQAFGIVFSIHQGRERERAVTEAYKALDIGSQPLTPERREFLSKQFTANLGPYLEAMFYRRLAPPPADDRGESQA